MMLSDRIVIGSLDLKWLSTKANNQIKIGLYITKKATNTSKGIKRLVYC